MQGAGRGQSGEGDGDAWGVRRMEMRDLECVQRGEMEERVRTESLKRRGGGRWRWAQKKREDRGRGRPGREMDVREIGSVRWVLKGRDGAWRRWVVRDEEEMMMGKGVMEERVRTERRVEGRWRRAQERWRVMVMKKGGGFCEMMRGCSVREMAARGAWGLRPDLGGRWSLEEMGCKG